MKNMGKKFTLQVQGDYKFANVSDPNAEVLKKIQDQDNKAEQRLFIALDVEMKKIFSTNLIH